MTLNDQYECERSFFKMDFGNSGPQGQLVYSLRFPVSYKNIQSKSQRVSFLNYFDWMGQIREYSLRPVMQEISKLTETGEWGLATNTVNLNVLGLLKADDVLEGRLWLDKITGLNNIYHLSFDWLRFLGVDSYERVALSNIVVSCVKIVGHGEAVITMPPNFLRIFFDNMKPKSKKKKYFKKYKTLFSNIDFGHKIKDCGDDFTLLFEQSYQTSLEHSNLIGNVYFSNYSKWINSTKDLFLYRNRPGLFSKNGYGGEFITVGCSISHLQEAMPFDEILVKMYLSQLYTNGAVLKYEVFKVQRNSLDIKLANVVQTIVFVENHSLRPKVENVPQEILSIFLKGQYAIGRT